MQKALFSVLTVQSITQRQDETNGLFFDLRLEHPQWSSFKPGQFAMLRPEGWALDMPWARPLSISALSSDTLHFLFQVAGRGTARMAELKPGDRIHVWGPLGTGFAFEPEKPVLMLAGGIGLAPFVGYAQNHPAPEKLHLLFGHRFSSACYPLEAFPQSMPFEDYPENSLPDREHFLAEVDKAIALNAAQGGLVLACGPTPFLKAVKAMGEKHKARLQLSLENRMACGVGACLGCVVTPSEHNTKAQGQPQRACVNGPVFWAESISLEG